MRREDLGRTGAGLDLSAQFQGGKFWSGCAGGEETGWEVLGEEGSESLEYSRRVEFRRSVLVGSLLSWLGRGEREGVFRDENCDVMIGGNLAEIWRRGVRRTDPISKQFRFTATKLV